MIGPVQEKLTNASVKAINKIEISPPVAEALLSTELAQLLGKAISNQPKNDKAKTMSNRQKKMPGAAPAE